MNGEQRLEGLVLKCSPLGEADRLLTLLSNAEGLTRLAVPGARKPKSSLAAAVPLALLSLQVSGSRGLRRVRQLQVQRKAASAQAPVRAHEEGRQHHPAEFQGGTEAGHQGRGLAVRDFSPGARRCHQQQSE